jgi:CRP/FNR family cyclic AMP-dependent transcriptional regulator
MTMTRRLHPQPPAAPLAFLDGASERAVVRYERGDTIFAQGDDGEHILYIRSGGVMVSALSPAGEKAVIAMLGAGDFLGEGCLAGQTSRRSTAVAISPSAVVPVARERMTVLLHRRHDVSDRFLAHVLTRNVRMQEDLTDQIFGAGEARLARTLLRLAGYGDVGRPVSTLARIADTRLAELAGTTVSRVHLCLERFKRLGFVDYRDRSRLTINHSLLNVVLGG